MARLSSTNRRSFVRPRSGIFSHLPPPWIPYAELARINVGIFSIFYPFLIGSLFAACISPWQILPAEIISTLILLLSVAFMLQIPGCVWNDIIDRDIDRCARRTRLRPMAQSDIPIPNAVVFFVAQFAVASVILFSMGKEVLYYSVSLVALEMVRPFAKRVTSYPGVVLGFVFSIGELVGCSTLAVDPRELMKDDTTDGGSALACLFLSYIAWHFS